MREPAPSPWRRLRLPAGLVVIAVSIGLLSSAIDAVQQPSCQDAAQVANGTVQASVQCNAVRILSVDVDVKLYDSNNQLLQELQRRCAGEGKCAVTATRPQTCRVSLAFQVHQGARGALRLIHATDSRGEGSVVLCRYLTQ